GGAPGKDGLKLRAAAGGQQVGGDAVFVHDDPKDVGILPHDVAFKGGVAARQVGLDPCGGHVLVEVGQEVDVVGAHVKKGPHRVADEGLQRAQGLVVHEGADNFVARRPPPARGQVKDHA